MSVIDQDAVDVEQAVYKRYSRAAKTREASLCCPIVYDPALLAAIPEDVIERDYGCGDPSAYLKEGEIVLDLGSGSGKICFIASQVVGERGRVIGVDINNEMLALARRSAPDVAGRVGHANVEFKRGRIQDLALDLDLLDAYLSRSPIRSSEELPRLEAEMARLRREAPLVADGAVDVVISNCVLNLVRAADKRQLIEEIHRILRLGGRAVISDIVSDKEVPKRLQHDPELWSGCVAGALREDLFLEAFRNVGFNDVEVVARDEAAWRTVEDIDFRGITVVAYKKNEGRCLNRKGGDDLVTMENPSPVSPPRDRAKKTCC